MLIRSLFKKRLVSTFFIRENSRKARIAAFFLKSDNAAIVFGRTIYLYGIRRDDFLADTRFLRHELKHVEQYHQYGFLKFIGLYLAESIRHGYYNNALEKEARAAESDETILSRFRPE